MNSNYIKILISLLSICLLFSIYRCENPFATREAEPPSGEKSSWIPPIDPGSVLSNLQSAFKEKNVENYMNCLVDSARLFRFVPDQYEASNSAGIFENWNLIQEQLYINKLFISVPDDSVRNLAFSNIQRSDFPDSVLIRADYELSFDHVLSSSFAREGRGQVDFWFIQRNGYWVISRWIDHETEVDSTVRIPSWSTIKANFINL